MKKTTNVPICVLFIWIIWNIIMLLTLPVSANQAHENADAATVAWQVPVFFVSDFYASTLLHESGHALVGVCQGAKLENFRINLDGTGEVRFEKEDELSKPGRIAMLAAGFVTNRLVAYGVNSYLDNNEYNISQQARALLGGAYITNMTQVDGGIWLSCLEVVFGDKLSGDDFQKIAYRLSDGHSGGFYAVMGLFFAASVADVVLSYNDIVNNIDRLAGRYPQANNGSVQIAQIGTCTVSAVKGGGVFVENKWKF